MIDQYCDVPTGTHSDVHWRDIFTNITVCDTHKKIYDLLEEVGAVSWELFEPDGCTTQTDKYRNLLDAVNKILTLRDMDALTGPESHKAWENLMHAHDALSLDG